MKLLYRMLFLTFLFQWLGCATPSLRGPNRPFDLSTVERIRPGRTKKSEVRALLGKPDHITDFDTLEHVNEGGITWGYDQGKYYEKLSLFFEKGSNVVSSVLWDVLEKEPESNLKKALVRYKGARWKSRSQKQNNPHATPTKCYFEDREKGISIEFSRTRMEVDHISWWDPRRTPANKLKRPKAEINCIGGKCHEYDPAELKWRASPCVLPR